jgi:hypothetical protein
MEAYRASNRAPLRALLHPLARLCAQRFSAPGPYSHAYRSKFAGTHEHRVIAGGIRHNLPQEALQAFVQAMIDVDGH